jgi:hypothetical protein
MIASSYLGYLPFPTPKEEYFTLMMIGSALFVLSILFSSYCLFSSNKSKKRLGNRWRQAIMAKIAHKSTEWQLGNAEFAFTMLYPLNPIDDEGYTEFGKGGKNKAILLLTEGLPLKWNGSTATSSPIYFQVVPTEPIERKAKYHRPYRSQFVIPIKPPKNAHFYSKSTFDKNTAGSRSRDSNEDSPLTPERNKRYYSPNSTFGAAVSKRNGKHIQLVNDMSNSMSASQSRSRYDSSQKRAIHSSSKSSGVTITAERQIYGNSGNGGDASSKSSMDEILAKAFKPHNSHSTSKSSTTNALPNPPRRKTKHLKIEVDGFDVDDDGDHDEEEKEIEEKFVKPNRNVFMKRESSRYNHFGDIHVRQKTTPVMIHGMNGLQILQGTKTIINGQEIILIGGGAASGGGIDGGAFSMGNGAKPRKDHPYIPVPPIISPPPLYQNAALPMTFTESGCEEAEQDVYEED